jgi:hypothetical protein
MHLLPGTPIKFWGQVYPRRTAPIYRHPSLVPILEGQPWVVWEYVDPDDRCITDDHIWVGNLEVLIGGGGWTDFETVESGKRFREDHSRERMEGRSSSPADTEPGHAAIQYGDEDAAFEEEVCPLNSFDFLHR